VSADIRTTLEALLAPGPVLLTIEPIFWFVLAGVVCGVAFQAVIVSGMIATMLGAAVPHHVRRYRHQIRNGSVMFGGRRGAHAHPAMG
jgi:hypothetical protein